MHAGTRSFNTAQAAQPNTTAEVLHQWQQETERRQQLHAETHRDLDQPIHSRKAGNRRRRSQRLNIVQGPENPPSSNQHRPFALHTLQHQQQPALHDMPSKQYMGHSVPSSSQTVQPAQQTKSVRKQIQPKGTNLRSLATTTMLWSQADLLQQLQQVRAHRPDNGLVTESDRIQAVQMQSPATVAQLGSANLLQRRLAQLHTSQEQQDTPVVGHAPESSQHSVAQLDSTQQTGGAELDTMSLALDLVDNQLPSWSHKQPLDWSAQHNLSFYHPQVTRMAGTTLSCMSCMNACA